MLKVLVVDDTPDRSSARGLALGALEGVLLTCAPSGPLELRRCVVEAAPDIVLIGTDSPSRDVLEQLAAMSDTAPRPIVLFTEDAYRQLRADLSEARLRLADRKDVERAKGILMKSRGMGEEEAFVALRTLAMQRGVRLGEAARQMIEVAVLLR